MVLRTLNAESPEASRRPAQRVFGSKSAVFPKRLLNTSGVKSVKAPAPKADPAKKKRAKPGVKARKDIIAAQKRASPIFPWAWSARFIKECAQEAMAEMGWTTTPRVQAIVVSRFQDHMENVTVDIFDKSMYIMITSGIKTLRPRHIHCYTKVSTIHKRALGY